ncbi:CHAD domain-containing protein [Nocardioides thalensis]|uniref:CHAD domain-containing protein n=1 Tax=Nocardioides thalensis TaxID=1914755 RepID=A0A853C2U0_9ACTN|nr:CHAD domain-containing protein [Nocardioides thalensis]NYJ00653.1 CHAD domain-containing protein [Nocardioides thalensis]
MAAPDLTVGELLPVVLDDLAGRIAERTPAALADAPDGVHQLRTEVRRLRNVLAAFGGLLDPGPVGAVRAQLSSYGDRLGRARDLEVRAADAAAAAAAVGLGAGPSARLVGPLAEAHRTAHAKLVAWVGGHEEIAGLSELGAVTVVGGGRPARVVAQEVLLAQADRALAREADYLSDPDAGHALRKAARRLRHVADAVTKEPGDVLGEPATALGKAGKGIQSLLGDQRDALLLAECVRGLLPDAGPDAPAYLEVVAHAEQRAAAALGDVPGALAELERRRAVMDAGP